MATYYQDAFRELEEIVGRALRSGAADRLINELRPFAADLDEAEACGGHWFDHPTHGADQWRDEVSAGDTRLSYWGWVVERLDQEAEAAGLQEDAAP